MFKNDTFHTVFSVSQIRSLNYENTKNDDRDAFRERARKSSVCRVRMKLIVTIKRIKDRAYIFYWSEGGDRGTGNPNRRYTA